MPRQPRVVIDACALYPNLLRDTLLMLAEADLYQLVWSEEILEEVRRNLVENGAAPAEKAVRTISLIRSAFAEGRVTNYDRHLPLLKNDPKDRHVLAAALEGEATLVVTSNLRHFAAAILPDGIAAVSPDEFLVRLFEKTPAAIIETIRRQAARFKKPPMEAPRLVESLRPAAPKFAEAVSKVIHVYSLADLEKLTADMNTALERIRTGASTDSDWRAINRYFDARAAEEPDFERRFGDRVAQVAPEIIRSMAKMALNAESATDRAGAQSVLATYGIDASEVAGMSDETILALLDRSQLPQQ